MKPSDINHDCSRLFGKCEMELAAKRVVVLCVSNGDTWLTHVRMAEMENQLERTGFFLLKENGWFQNTIPHPSFIERVSSNDTRRPVTEAVQATV